MGANETGALEKSQKSRRVLRLRTNLANPILTLSVKYGKRCVNKKDNL